MNWIIRGDGKVGKEMSDADRSVLFGLLREQHRERIKRRDGKITCPCGRATPPSHQYRCYHCDVTFCHNCASIHFGDRNDYDNRLERPVCFGSSVAA